VRSSSGTLPLTDGRQKVARPRLLASPVVRDQHQGRAHPAAQQNQFRDVAIFYDYMKATMFWCVLTLVACGCDARSPDPSRWTIQPSQFGPLPIPSTFARAASVLGEQLVVPSDPEDASCSYIRPKRLRSGVSLMIKFDTIVRVDIDTTGVLTTDGVGVGDTEERVLTVYHGHAKVDESPYSGPEGHDIRVRLANDSAHALIFQTWKGRVYSFRAGRFPEVAYIEGCS
jgi:hypothetical protein